MTVRMTGVTGLLDTDSLVKASMMRYTTKVDTQKQKLQTMQWQQEQYRTVVKDSKSFYDKYLDPLGSKSLSLSSKYTTTKFTSNNENMVTATTSNGAVVDTYTVSVTQLASKASTTLSDTSGDQTITINDGSVGKIEIKFTASSDGTATVESYNDAVSKMKSDLQKKIDTGSITDDITTAKAQLAALNANTIKATYSEFNETVTFTASEMGKGGFKLNGNSVEDNDLQATIINGAGVKYTISGLTTNSKTIDGVTFNFKGVNAKATDKDAEKLAKATTLTGKADVTDFKDTITDFVNDYNTLLTSINSKIYETRDKSYTPLTDEQKDEMSDDEIEKWEKKAQTGLLRKDSYLEDLAQNMKDAMSTFMSSTGLNLEEIGIEPVKDYGSGNGLFTIDDDKLITALETNFDNVKDLFIKGISTSDTKNGGAITKLKDAIYSGAVSSTAGLVTKAGKDTGVSSLTNEMSKQITEMKKNIKEMEAALEERENALYTKYASIESTLSSLQSQQDSLSSYFTSSN